MKLRLAWLESFKPKLPKKFAEILREYFKEILVALVLAIVAAIVIDPLWAAHKERLRAAILHSNLRAVATLQVLDKHNRLTGQGSGFFINTTGVLVTNYHVIKGAAGVVAHLPSGAFYAFKGYREVDERSDIAILQFDARDTPSVVGPGDSDKLQVGDEVYAIGTPTGLEATVSNGAVSNPSREVGGVSFIQFTAPISPGSSGGGLFNTQGEIIGVTAASQNISAGPQAGTAQNVNFAVPINSVKNLLSGEVRDLKRESAELYYSLGNLADNKRQWNHAIQFYRKALAVNPQYLDAYVGLGGDYYELGQYDVEVESYQKASLEDPNNAEAAYLLATAYEDVGRYDSAIEAYKRSLAIDPLHKDALHDLSIVYLAVGQPDSARNLLPRLMAVDKGWGRELQVLIDRMR